MVFNLIILVLFCIQNSNAFFQIFSQNNKVNSQSNASLKQEILNLSRKVERGIVESDEEAEEMLSLFEALEKKNPTKKSLTSPLLNKEWILEYTTSESIRGSKMFPKVGPILQMLDNKELKAKNSETVSYFGIKVKRAVTAELTPVSESLCDVQFKKFTIGPITFNAPESFKGSLDITYLDNDFRLSRGDKGNIFVLRAE